MRILLFTGKGGVGKTTSAARPRCDWPIGAARRCCVSTDAAHSVADASARDRRRADRGDPRTIGGAGRCPASLEAAWRDIQHYLLQLLDQAGVDPIAAEELAVLPGIEEVLSLLAVRDLATTSATGTRSSSTARRPPRPCGCSPCPRRSAGTSTRSCRPSGGWRAACDRSRRCSAAPTRCHRRTVRGARPLCEELASVRKLLADPPVTSVRLVLTPEAVVDGRGPSDAHGPEPLRLRGRSGRRQPGLPEGAPLPAQQLVATVGGRAATQLEASAASFAGIDIRKVPVRGGRTGRPRRAARGRRRALRRAAGPRPGRRSRAAPTAAGRAGRRRLRNAVAVAAGRTRRGRRVPLGRRSGRDRRPAIGAC